MYCLLIGVLGRFNDKLSAFGQLHFVMFLINKKNPPERWVFFVEE